MIKTIKEAVEIERQDRIKTLKEMAEGRHDSTYEIADTNAKLSDVHKELKRIFQYIEVNCVTTKIFERYTQYSFSYKDSIICPCKKPIYVTLKSHSMFISVSFTVCNYLTLD